MLESAPVWMINYVCGYCSQNMLSGISRVSERVYSTKPTAKFVPFHGKLLFKVFDFIIFSMALTLQSKKKVKKL